LAAGLAASPSYSSSSPAPAAAAGGGGLSGSPLNHSQQQHLEDGALASVEEEGAAQQQQLEEQLGEGQQPGGRLDAEQPPLAAAADGPGTEGSDVGLEQQPQQDDEGLAGSSMGSFIEEVEGPPGAAGARRRGVYVTLLGEAVEVMGEKGTKVRGPEVVGWWWCLLLWWWWLG